MMIVERVQPSRFGRTWFVSTDIETQRRIRELLDALANREVGHEQVREDMRSLGVPAEFKWASPEGTEDFEMGDTIVVVRLLEPARTHFHGRTVQ